MMMKSNEKFNLWFNVFILAGMTVAVVLTNIYKLQQPGARHFMLIFASIGALTGVMNTVLSANGNIWTFLFGVIDVSIASIVAFDSSIRPGGEPVWGNFALHAFYFLPMQFVGWRQWRKRGATSKEKVTARRLTASQGALTAGALAIGTVVAYFILCAVSGKESADASYADSVRRSRIRAQCNGASAYVSGVYGAVDNLASCQCLFYPALGRQSHVLAGFQLHCGHGNQIQFLSSQLHQRAENMAPA